MFETGYIGEDNAKHPETRGWFLGPFIDQKSPFHDLDFEMKWIERIAGEVHIGSTSSLPRKTILIMLEGHGCMEFPSHNTEIPLIGKGAYVIFDTSLCTHNFRAITDCSALAIRFLHG